eukprot:4564263-Alexandrium_andersonii.AAC.1
MDVEHHDAVGLAVGSEVVVLYHVRGVPTWHARLIIGQVAAQEYVICTPDYDLYEEEYSNGKPDVVAWRARGPMRALPAGVPGPGGV